MISFVMIKQFIGITIIALIYIKTNKDNFDSVKDIKGKNVVITGASQGLGEQLAYHYARMGANVFLTARREKQLQQVLETCKNVGHEGALFGYLATDMEMYEVAARKIVNDAVVLFGRIDHIILNHAYSPELEIWTGTDEQLSKYEKTINVNTVSFVHLISHALPYIKKSKHGRVGVISSLAGKIDSPFFTSYSSSKFALDGFFSALRTELIIHKENISITLCNLGFIGFDNSNTNIGRKAMGEVHNIDFNIFPFSLIFPLAKPDDTAMEIIKSTAKGERELYYPPVLGSKYIVQIYPVLRHIF